jgi:DNA mismatch repair protein MutS2
MTYTGYGRVIKGVGGLFTVRVFDGNARLCREPYLPMPLDGKTVFARGRGVLHRKGALLVGDLVEIPGVRTAAEVVSVGKDGTLQLKAGVLKMKARADEVRLIENDERAAGVKQAKPSVSAAPRREIRAAAQRELDIRGMETLEADSVVETFLSAAVMGHLDTVTIIHGKGTGALRKAVHDILRRNKAVKTFRLGMYGEGENGVTIVTLK